MKNIFCLILFTISLHGSHWELIEESGSLSPNQHNATEKKVSYPEVTHTYTKNGNGTQPDRLILSFHAGEGIYTEKNESNLSLNIGNTTRIGIESITLNMTIRVNITSYDQQNNPQQNTYQTGGTFSFSSTAFDNAKHWVNEQTELGKSKNIIQNEILNCNHTIANLITLPIYTDDNITIPYNFIIAYVPSGIDPKIKICDA